MTKADILIKALKLLPHPEGGFYRETYRSEETTLNLPKRYKGRIRNFGTSIFYLLKGEQYSAFHRICSDEIWHYYEGSPLKLYVIDRDGILKTYLLSNDINNGGNYQVIIKHNHWFAAKPIDPKGFTLLGCTVAPGFDFFDFQLAERKELIENFPQYRDIIMELTKK